LLVESTSFVCLLYFQLHDYSAVTYELLVLQRRSDKTRFMAGSFRVRPPRTFHWVLKHLRHELISRSFRLYTSASAGWIISLPSVYAQMRSAVSFLQSILFYYDLTCRDVARVASELAGKFGNTSNRGVQMGIPPIPAPDKSQGLSN
jgi:hypothetical protein